MREIEVYFYNKKIKNNDFIRPINSQIKPKVKYNFNMNKLYTLIMYDPDAINGTFIHWLVVNIKDDTNNGKIILSYKGPSPPPKTGEHRYIFELYEQDKRINTETNLHDIERSISISNIKNKLDISNYISKIQFISKNESGGKNNSSKRKYTKYKKNITRNNKKYIK
jgi:phosphatidylethanolamine-binding protein (PEBP) family uncharacterized protein